MDVIYLLTEFYKEIKLKNSSLDIIYKLDSRQYVYKDSLYYTKLDKNDYQVLIKKYEISDNKLRCKVCSNESSCFMDIYKIIICLESYCRFLIIEK